MGGWLEALEDYFPRCRWEAVSGTTILGRTGRKDRTGRQVAKIELQDAASGDPITIGPSNSINIDLNKLRPPDRIYDADQAWVKHSPTRVSLLFGKRGIDQPSRFRTRLEIRYPPEDVVRHLWKNSRRFHNNLKEFVNRWPSYPVDAFLETDSHADQDHSEWANFDYMAFVGSGGAIDFYHLPPSGIARFAQGQGSSWLSVVPVVRVMLTAFELTRFLDRIGRIIPEIMLCLPEGEREQLVEDQEEVSL